MPKLGAVLAKASTEFQNPSNTRIVPSPITNTNSGKLFLKLNISSLDLRDWTQGRLAGSVCGTYNSQSWGHEFKTHTGPRVQLKR